MDPNSEARGVLQFKTGLINVNDQDMFYEDIYNLRVKYGAFMFSFCARVEVKENCANQNNTFKGTYPHNDLPSKDAALSCYANDVLASTS